jgi:hypothetical protein
MIVRVLEAGQYDVSDDVLDSLHQLDDEVVAAAEAGDDARFASALAELVGRVQASGTKLPDDYLGASELVLPPADASLQEVQEMLSEEGLIPG